MSSVKIAERTNQSSFNLRFGQLSIGNRPLKFQPPHIMEETVLENTGQRING